MNILKSYSFIDFFKLILYNIFYVIISKDSCSLLQTTILFPYDGALRNRLL